MAHMQRRGSRTAISAEKISKHAKHLFRKNRIDEPGANDLEINNQTGHQRARKKNTTDGKIMDQTSERCKNIIGPVQFTCKNIMQIIQKDNAKLTQLLTRLRTTYYTRDGKRGLINAIGAISKTLFGIMDVEDEEHLNEQIQMLQEGQQTLQHATKTQIKIINATIGHMDALEKTVSHNENILGNVTARMELQLAKYTQREDMDENLLILRTIMTDLTKDVENTIDYLSLTKNGIVHE
ncbi:hypothetical protein P5V15_002588 [Pogonomyrmex californicus]